MTKPNLRLKTLALLARVLGKKKAALARLSDDTPLFSGGLSLDSLTGLELLTAIEQDFDVDIASEDLNLESLQTIGTLVDYLAAHSASSQMER
ncbi:MAG: acyl carrier protein [Chloroflexi bacterium]|nr:acyl carrier protein [Chloroflexota bacterium]